MSVNSSPEDRPPLKLGLFMPNCSNSYSISTRKRDPDDWTYESPKSLRDDAGPPGTDQSFALCVASPA
jgi:hypothetical protein